MAGGYVGRDAGGVGRGSGMTKVCLLLLPDFLPGLGRFGTTGIRAIHIW
jgi:hypothetical protein